jgi:hypothetical protein
MKKLVIGLLVVVMALGTMGVAFATSMAMDPSPNGVIAQGVQELIDVNCTSLEIVPHIGCSWAGTTFPRDVYGTPNYDTRGGAIGSAPYVDGYPNYYRSSLRGENAELGAYGVLLKFDATLYAGTGIFVALDDDDGHIINGNRWAEGHIILGGTVPAETLIYVPLEGFIWENDDIEDAHQVKVRVVGNGAAEVAP